MKKTVPLLILLAAILLPLVATCGMSDTPATAPSSDAGSQAVLSAIMTRASVRQFTSQPIGADTLDLLVKAGMAAPTAMNLQPWAFIVVTEQAMLDSLAAVHPYSNLQTATAAIIVCGDLDKAADGFGRDFWIQDCSAATENILIAAHAMGLGAVWCGVYPNPKVVPGVTRVLSIPERVIPLNIITMGHPAAEVQPKDKWNPQNVHYQKW